VTLHVGPGTFLPVKAEDTGHHKMHAEWGEVDRGDRGALNAVCVRGGGSCRSARRRCALLESAAGEATAGSAFRGETAIFITPGYRFRAADALLTNFHLPRSTLFMLVSAFAGLDDDEARLCACDREAGIASIPMATPACYSPAPMTEAFSYR
jgi:S-adenosylmethionine:tRNA ribosyltransferase-isomerase